MKEGPLSESRVSGFHIHCRHPKAGMTLSAPVELTHLQENEMPHLERLQHALRLALVQIDQQL